MSALSRLTSSLAVQVAIDECTRLGRAQFLQRFGFGKSRDFLAQDPKTLAWCDSKAVEGVAYGIQHPHEGALKPADFSGGEATVVSRLKALGFAVMHIGEDWSLDEVQATVIAYFDMLKSESEQRPYVKSSINGELRPKLKRRSQASVEQKFQNISAVLHHLNLPFVPGYKPRGNSQLLLRQVVQQYVLDHAQDMRQIIDTPNSLPLAPANSNKCSPNTKSGRAHPDWESMSTAGVLFCRLTDLPAPSRQACVKRCNWLSGCATSLHPRLKGLSGLPK